VALSIKTDEADALARRLTRLTGETMAKAVTAALRERLAREEARRVAAIMFLSMTAGSSLIRQMLHDRRSPRHRAHHAAPE
jgi:antitoxin VapB